MSNYRWFLLNHECLSSGTTVVRGESHILALPPWPGGERSHAPTAFVESMKYRQADQKKDG